MRWIHLLSLVATLFFSNPFLGSEWSRDQPRREIHGYLGDTGWVTLWDKWKILRAKRDICRAHYCPLHFQDRPNVKSVYYRQPSLCPEGDIQQVTQYLPLIPRPYRPSCGICNDCKAVFAQEYEYYEDEIDEDHVCYFCEEDRDDFGACQCWRRDERYFSTAYDDKETIYCNSLRGAWYYGYFLADYHQYYRFFVDHLQFCGENPECRSFWPEFLGESGTINDSAYDVFKPLVCEKLLDEEFYPSWKELGEHEQITTLVCYPAFYSHYYELSQEICTYIDQHTFEPDRAVKAINEIRTFLDKSHPLFLQLLGRSIETTPHPRLYWERSLIHYHRGESEDFFSDISALVEMGEKGKELIDSATYSKLGEIYLLACSFEEAVHALTSAIEKDPTNAEAHFLRAQAHFELGDFDASLEDFLKSGYQVERVSSGELLNFSIGMVKGLRRGGAVSLTTFLPSMLATINGLSNGIWALVTSPEEVSRKVVEEAVALFEFVRSHSTEEMFDLIAPEVVELIRKWDALEPKEKGEKIGFVIGKYGVDILACQGAFAGVKYYRALKNANALATLDVMASGGARSERMLAQAANYREQSIRMRQPGYFKIHPDKQGRHTLRVIDASTQIKASFHIPIHNACSTGLPEPVENHHKLSWESLGMGTERLSTLER